MKNIKTRENLEAAFAGESMAHMRYTYFAKICRQLGATEAAEAFEKTARDEIGHALGHLRFLYPESEMTAEKMLQISIEGETYEYTEMYPNFAKKAKEEGDSEYLKELDEQIAESKEHAENFAKVLPKLEKLFNGLAKVEEKHANMYSDALANLKKVSGN